MGFKRPFDDEEFQELPYKHSRQLDFTNKLTQFSEFGACDKDHQKPDISVGDEGGYCKYSCHEATEIDNAVNKFANSVNRDYETVAPHSWVMESSNEEDIGSKPTSYASLSLDGFEYNFSRRTFVPFEHSYSELLDSYPRKQVPLGPNHQASIPPWAGDVKKKTLHVANSLVIDNVDDVDYEEKLMGTCIIPMPDSELSGHNSGKDEESIIDCDCLGKGSVRCVQQHVMEAREKLLKSLGYEKFVKLGFCEMGEEVSRKWSEEEEQVFHEVVYSNPASLGRKFWKHLSAVFPYRAKKEIFSYYFNVFILRRRAAQNRSHLLDIDSDDDEWHGSYGGLCGVPISEVQEEDSSAIESPVYHNDQEDDSSSDDGDGDGDGGGGDAVGEDCGDDTISEVQNDKSFYESGFGSVYPYLDNIAYGGGNDLNDSNVQDDSCTSFEFQSDMLDSTNPPVDEARPALQENGAKTDLNKGLRDKFDVCNNDLTNESYLMDSCDAKVWGARFQSPIKGVDLLPTCNIIEEIFGQGTWDTMTRQD